MKVYVMLADGFEEIEALAVVDVLRRGEVETIMVSIMDNRTVTSARGIQVIADTDLQNIAVDKEDMIVLPGGLKGVQLLEACNALTQMIKSHHAEKGWLAAICAGPSLPGKLGIYQGLKATCYPGFEKELLGACACSDDVVVDQHLITSRGAGVSLAFAYKILSIIKGDGQAEKIKSAMLYRG